MSPAKRKGLLWALAAVAIGACFAIRLSFIARHVPWRVEHWMAGALGSGALERPCRGQSAPGSLAAFDQLVARIYPIYPADRELPITVDVVAGEAVNAFAALDGRIHVFDGLIKRAESPEELAGVIAHEIEHVRARHILQGLAVNLFTLSALRGGSVGDSRLAYSLLSMKFSRQQEAEADAEGLRRLQAAEVDAAGFGRFFVRAAASSEAPAWLSSHPASEARAELARKAGRYPTRPVLDAATWQTLRAICR